MKKEEAMAAFLIKSLLDCPEVLVSGFFIGYVVDKLYKYWLD
jgi:hypothetical protein